MPIYRKTTGGVFAPVSALNINDGGEFKSVAAAWVNDNGTFKQVFPNPPPVDAAESSLYNTASAVSLIAASSGNASLRRYAAQGSLIPITSTDTPTIRSSKVVFKDETGNIIQFGTDVSASATTGLRDEFTNILTYRTINNALGVAITDTTGQFPVKYWQDLAEGTMIVQEWEWTIGAQSYYHTFPATAAEDLYN